MVVIMLLIIVLTFVATPISSYVSISTINAAEPPYNGQTYLEFYALKSLYDSTSGDDWSNKTNWISPTVSWCNNWYGLLCEARTESITEIRLRYNDLQGSIPSSISCLSTLTILGLRYNSLTGHIPSELGLLSSLKFLDLDDNSLTGSIPSEVGLLSSLYRLDLDSNSLTGRIPSEIGLLSSLRRLYLRDNAELNGTIPVEVCRLIDNGLRISFNQNSIEYYC